MYDGLSDASAVIKGNFGGQNHHYSAGLSKLQIDDSSSVDYAYCVDFADRINGGDVLPEAPWGESDVANRDNVERILNSYHPIGAGPEGYEIEGTDAQKAAATQAAVWHFTNGFQLVEAAGDHTVSEGYATVFANYQTILKAVADGVLPVLGGPVTLSIEGDTYVDAIPGQLIGPFTIHTSAASADLTPSTGVTLHDEDGSPFEGPASDGNKVWLKASEAGYASLYALAAGAESGVRLFADDYVQDMAFLVVTPKEVMAEVEVKVHTPPTTSSSSTSTTSTTSSSTTTSSIVPQTSIGSTTTLAVVPQPSTGGGLPNTGAETLGLVAVALVLLAAGIGFGVISRRSRGQSP